MTLNVSHNKMFDLPSSLGQCSRLLELDAQDNLLDALPDTLSSMTSLVKARLGSNSLSSLPPSLAACTNITDLGLEANCFQSIPDFIMNLASLTRLNLEGNQLRSLPPALGFLSGTLKELQVQGNPLVDPPADELTGGLEPILWQCRQRYYAMQRSNPPSMRVHKFGIMHEKLELRPKFEMKLMDAVSKSKHSGTFHFMMEGLDEFPRQLFHDPETLPALTSIRLDSNNLGGEVIQWELTDQEVKRHRQLADNAVSLRKVVIAGAGTTTTFVNLCQLSLKSCHLSVLDDSIGALVNLRELHLPRNSLEALPRGLLSLKKLRNLDVSRNRLLSIPPELGVLYHLEDLNLSRNRIEVLPRDFIAGMVHLKTLNVSNNFIGEIPASITGLEGLESLDVGGNCLRTLPTGFGNLRLAIFRASFNRLEFLSDATFEPNLGGALHVLWLANNNLQELPRSIVSLKDLREVQVSGNPMRSPPPELLAEGNAALIQYCRVRSARLVELVSAFKHGGLETLEVYMRPKARGVLSLCDTGYLTPADLAEVDSACDRYVNSKFYEHPMPAREVVEVIHALMTLRRREFCDAIISQLVACLQDHENRTVFGEGVFQRELLRPWGPDKSSVGCFAVSLDALFESFPTSSFTPNGRDSLWSEVQKALPPSIFPYDSAALKLAISTVKCATGCLARMERQVSYSQCECIDWETGQEVRHPAGECQKPSLLVIRVPYSEDDLIRRAAEKNRIKGEFRRIYTECYDFTTSKEGLAHMRQEVKQRKAHLGIQMGECDIVIAQNQVVVKAQKEIMKLARQRQALFDAGQPYHLHNLKDADEATECVASVQRKLDAAQAAINAANERKLEFKRRRDKSTFVELADHARSTLCAKYCIARHIEIIEQGRLMAIKYGWRRQWDGLDGIDFVRWAKERNLRAAYRHEFPSNRVRYKAMLDPLEEEERATYASSSEPIPLHEKYSFEGSSKVVEELKDPVYEQWLLEREEGESANSVQSEGDHQHESGEDDNELMSQKSEE
jgi:Leucine-rich repeat (LRR) protein